MRDERSPCLSQLLLFSELGKPCSQFLAFQFLESRAPGDHNSNKCISICFLTREDLRLLQGFFPYHSEFCLLEISHSDSPHYISGLTRFFFHMA